MISANIRAKNTRTQQSFILEICTTKLYIDYESFYDFTTR